MFDRRHPHYIFRHLDRNNRRAEFVREGDRLSSGVGEGVTNSRRCALGGEREVLGDACSSGLDEMDVGTVLKNVFPRGRVSFRAAAT